MTKTILAVGASSSIMQALLRLYAEEENSFVLVGRNAERLDVVKNDLVARGGRVLKVLSLDFERLGTHDEFVRTVVSSHPDINTVIVGHGALGDQKDSQSSFVAAEESIVVNYLSYVSILNPVAEVFEKANGGSIVAISSVAGDRGRQSNYIYGSAKAGLTCYLSGLRNRLFKSNVNVLTVKPGFVDTPMTADVPKNFLFAQPGKVAKNIYDAERRAKGCLYTPWVWRPIMWVIRCMPESIFKRLNL